MTISEQQYRDELKKELEGVPYTSMGSNADKQTSTGEMQTGEESTSNIQQSVDDVANMPRVMMSRKKRKILEAMEVTLFLAWLCWLFN